MDKGFCDVFKSEREENAILAKVSMCGIMLAKHNFFCFGQTFFISLELFLKIHALGYLANNRENNYNGGEERCIIVVLMCG
ncbi:MAG: hypothetical protein J6J44_09385 [Lachnospiraceae bacterium]|nr:hypothetical protein [Lachnospiraceae bacterium]